MRDLDYELLKRLQVEMGRLRQDDITRRRTANLPGLLGEDARQHGKALVQRVVGDYESALAEVELWNKSASSQLDAQLRERRRNFARRLEAIERIQQAASGLDERISEIDEQEGVLNELDSRLTELTSYLLDAPPLPSAPRETDAAANGLALATSA